MLILWSRFYFASLVRSDGRTFARTKYWPLSVLYFSNVVVFYTVPVSILSPVGVFQLFCWLLLPIVDCSLSAKDEVIVCPPLIHAILLSVSTYLSCQGSGAINKWEFSYFFRTKLRTTFHLIPAGLAHQRLPLTPKLCALGFASNASHGTPKRNVVELQVQQVKLNVS